jgi:methylated-DNA-[protein]-cysteine S-methyltransferase
MMQRIEHPSPVGVLTLTAERTGLTGIYFDNHSVGAPPPGDAAPNAHLDQARKQLDQYFSGRRKVFDLPLAPSGTPFQMRVWVELLKIPFGETTSYGAIADALNNPNAVRAVGGAVGRNPISIIVPCHRVIGASGKLTGFAGGLPRKERLLGLEQGGLLIAP